MGKRNNIFQKVKHYIPKKFWPAVYCIFVLGIKWISFRSGRSSGKTNFLQIITVLKCLAEPNGDVIWLRDFQNHNKQTMEGVEKWIDRFSSVFPELDDFVFNKREYIAQRVLSDGKVQTIHFLGVDAGGVRKIKGFEKNNGYFSLLCLDEAEELEGIKTDTEREKDYAEIQTIAKTLSRREGIYTKKPSITIMVSSNPKVQNSWQWHYFYDEYLPDDEEKLKKDFIDYKVITSFDGGNGLYVCKNNFLMIVEESKTNPLIDIAESEVKSYLSLKNTNPAMYDNDVLGLERVPEGALYLEHINFFNSKLPKMMPTVLGIDYGIIDDAVITLRGREFETKDKKFKLLENGGTIDVFEISGIKQKKATTLEQKEERKNAVSIATLKYIKENIMDNSNLPYWSTWLKRNRLIIAGGPKDYEVLNRMRTLTETVKEFRELEYLLIFTETKGLYSEFDTKKRHAFLKNEILLNREEYLNKDITPRLYEYFKSVDIDNYKEHPYLQNVADSYFNGLFTDLKENG